MLITYVDCQYIFNLNIFYLYQVKAQNTKKCCLSCHSEQDIGAKNTARDVKIYCERGCILLLLCRNLPHVFPIS